RPVRLRMDSVGNLRAMDGHAWRHLTRFEPDRWLTLALDIDVRERSYSVSVDGQSVLGNAALTEDVYSIERLSFRTGTYRDTPRRTTPNQDPASPLPDADERVPAAVYFVDDVKASSR